ncbi:CDP-glycerol glycerophosphotransferase family protein [Paenisporosarcina antarctica]|nr:CDP-glycerol glycerophosphotransferase family protein [Paenisporosarcina antarctica]
MKVYSNNILLLEDSIHKIEFTLSENGTIFHLYLDHVNDVKPLILGEYPLEDQVLLKKTLTDQDIIIYIKSENIMVTTVSHVPNEQFQITENSHEMITEAFSDLLLLKQTGETSLSIFNNKGHFLFSIHDIVTQDPSIYVYPVELELTTIEFRYLTIAKIKYASYYQFIIYDLFRKELITKKVIFSVDSFDSEFGLGIKLISPNSIEISFETDCASIDFKKISAKGTRVFDIYQSEKLRGRHILGILTINGSKYYLHNKLAGVFLTRTNPMKISGFYPNMKSRFVGKNLYIFGRNTHYAYKASGRYDYLYIGDNEKSITKFVRPFNIRFLRRYGFYKVPIDSLNVNNVVENKVYLGNEKTILHNLKLKLRPGKSKILDYTINNDQVNIIGTNSRGHMTSSIVPKSKEYTMLKRNFIMLKNLKNSKFLLKVFRSIFVVMGWMPKKKKLVMFESFHAKQYSDNPRAIYEYMKEQHKDYQLLWSIDKQSIKLFDDFQVPYVTRFSLQWFLTFPRAKYWVNNVRLPGWMPKPEGTVYVQTWHGTPLKKLGLDIEQIHMPGTKTDTYKRNFINESRNWDYLVSPNAYSTEIFKRAFHYDGQVIESGYPRNDVLSIPSEDVVKSLKQKLGIPEEKKIMLYAPTWRDNEFHKKGKYKFNFKFDLENWKREFGSEWVLLSRMHYLIAENFDFSAHEGTVYDVSSYPDIRELYLSADLLITDYSSVFFDFAILNRPIVFFMYDLETYRDELRGFYMNIQEDAPGPIVQTEEELFQAINELEQSNVQSNPTFKSFKTKFSSLEDGHATKRVVQAFLK